MAATVRGVYSCRTIPKATFAAGAAISGSWATPIAVYLSAEWAVTTTATSSGSSTYNILGFCVDTVASGENVTVYLVGDILMGTAGEDIAAGEWVTASAATAGYLDDADTTSDIIAGMALMAAGAGEPIAFVVSKNGVLAL